jgi:hypothetical protein
MTGGKIPSDVQFLDSYLDFPPNVDAFSNEHLDALTKKHTLGGKRFQGKWRPGTKTKYHCTSVGDVAEAKHEHKS